MKFFIADNDVRYLSQLKVKLTAIYPDASIWPPNTKTLTSWSTVATELEANTSDSDDLVVILDLALEAEDMQSVRAGVEHASALRGLRPAATFIAYTQWADAAQKPVRYGETFDGLIDKQEYHHFESSKEQQTYVRQAVNAAVGKRAGATRTYSHTDSLGLRLAVAAFGDQALDDLVQDVAHGWRDVQISALTSGFSGASLLAITGRDHGGVQRIIVKCARDREVIEGDTHRVNQYLGELGPLAEALAPYDQQVHALPRNRGYYYRQAEIRGETLLNRLSRHEWNEEARGDLEPILDLEMRCYSRSSSEPFAELVPADKLSLSPIDVGRATQSLEFLRDIGQSIKDRSAWPTAFPPPVEIVSMMRNTIASWNTRMGSEKPLLGVAQHGDLNPSNVLIPTRGKLVLIDFSRLGRWPVGYDIARLAVLLRLRLTDHEQHRDWIEHRLTDWVAEEFANPLSSKSTATSNCPWANYCDKRFGSFVQEREVAEQQTIIRGYQLATLWDLIKVLSYTDLPPLKRVWALVACWYLSNTLNLTR